MPTPKKPPGKRQRTNKPKPIDRQLTAIKAEVEEAPKPPVGLPKPLQQEWETMWASEIASSWNKDTDLMALRRLFSLYDRLTTYEKEASRMGSVSTGSTGQLKMHPLLQAADSLRGQILQLEDRFGLTPMARLKLGIALGDAAASLDSLNARLNSAGGADGDEDNSEDDEADYLEVIEGDATG